MEQIIQINYQNAEKQENQEKILNIVTKKCFEIEKINNKQFYISVTLTDNETIKSINKKYRNIDKETDVLSFPMFEREEIEKILKEKNSHQEVLGDIIISIPKVIEQAKEYGHTFERELSYMLVHGFYHLMGYDHMEEKEKKIMREKEESVLQQLQIQR